MKIWQATVLSLAMAVPAAAQDACPTIDDLAGGIRFETATGEIETFRRYSDDIVESYYAYSPDEGVRSMLVRGLYLVEVMEMADGKMLPGSRTTYSFPMAADALPQPEPGTTWSVTLARLDSAGLASEQQDYVFGPAQTRTYGGCAYQMIPVEIAYPDDPDPELRDILHYLPELGLSYVAAFKDSNGSDTYDYIGIERLQ